MGVGMGVGTRAREGLSGTIKRRIWKKESGEMEGVAVVRAVAERKQASRTGVLLLQEAACQVFMHASN